MPNPPITSSSEGNSRRDSACHYMAGCGCGSKDAEAGGGSGTTCPGGGRDANATRGRPGEPGGGLLRPVVCGWCGAWAA
eukprot:11842164-Alexandrium_andersonii.AAC.1